MKHFMRNRVLCALLMLPALAGCAGYRLGSTLPPDIKSVHVPAFSNKSGEPLVETESTKAVITELQRDGTLRVAERLEADAILDVTLVAFGLEPVRYERDSPKTAQEYRMRLTAEMSLTHARTGEVLLKKKVVGKSTFEPAGDISASKRNAIPDAARDLAHEIVEAVVEFW